MKYSNVPLIPGLDGDFLPPNSPNFGIRNLPRDFNVWVRPGPPPAPAPAPALSSNGNASEASIPSLILALGIIGGIWWLSSK